MNTCYLFDIDGTLADINHRLWHILRTSIHDAPPRPKDYEDFFDACVDDKPIEHMWELLRDLYGIGTTIVYVSGRSDDRVRKETEDWLLQHKFPRVGDVAACMSAPNALYMRKAGDHRPDYIVKGELLDQILADGWKPIMAFEDRKQVVDMWRKRGIPCAQVAEGNY